MAEVSITNALRTPKVSAQFAPNASSERFQDQRLVIKPQWLRQDGYGRQVGYHTQNVLTAGAHHPLARMLIESAQRPAYSPTLNTQGISGDEQYYGNSFGRADTLGVNRGQAFQMYGEYSVPGPTNFIPHELSSTERDDDAFKHERVRMERALRRRYEFNRYSQSGM
jgi:hypothetical protein